MISKTTRILSVAAMLTVCSIFCAKDCEKTKSGEMMMRYASGGRTVPFVVDVRMEARSSDFWAVGSLLSVKHVLTSCRLCYTYIQFMLHSRNIESEEDTESRNRPIAGAKVLFCKQYLWEGSDSLVRFPDYGKRLLFNDSSSGKRPVMSMSPHPKCAFDPLQFDFGVATMTTGISIWSPHLSLISVPNPGDPVTDYSECYVATIGRRDQLNRTNPITDFKVRIPVTKVSMMKCKELNVQPCTRPGICHLKTTFNESIGSLLCFAENISDVSLCDNARGAPLVCRKDDKYTVQGIVVLGMETLSCFAQKDHPVLVSTFDDFSDYFMDSLYDKRVFINTMKQLVPNLYSGRSSAPLHLLSSYVLLLMCFIIKYSSR